MICSLAAVDSETYPSVTTTMLLMSNDGKSKTDYRLKTGDRCRVSRRAGVGTSRPMPTGLCAMMRGLAAGAAAGAAGTTALNAATYLDMSVRGRPTSDTPEQTVEALASKAGAKIPGEGETRDNRVAGLGPLSGVLTGVGIGALAGALRGLGVRVPFPLAAVGVGGAAMAGADLPMAALGVTDPRTWPPSSWAADAGPHLAYGVVTVAVLRGLIR